MHKSSKNAVKHKDLIDLVPFAPSIVVDWDQIWSLWPQLPALDNCPQDKIHHAEGDVGIHTRLVVEALITDAEWQNLARDDQTYLFWAAVLHDVGKPAVTKHEEDGRISSKGHSRVGALITRDLLWSAGSPFAWREAVCGIIMKHQLPFWIIERPDPIRLAIETSWQCRPDHLCIHARADANGRVCADKASILESVTLAVATFEEAECLRHRFAFGNDESRVSFFDIEERDPHYTAHEDFRCQVAVMSGLPGAGKDTWIAENLSEAPVVSLDVIREKMGISAKGNQGRVIQGAYEAAREHLRNREDFVWNATNVTRQNRLRVLRLLRDYNAHIEIVYVEVPPEQLYRQNQEREDAVPVNVIEHLVRKLEPPEKWEAHRVTIVA